MKALAIARRELAAALESPASHFVAAAFLALNGWSFWIALSVGNGAMTPGAALRLYFGGSLPYWIAQVAIAATLSMRLIAEERRSGTLEALRSTPVSGFQIALGKLLGALGFYALVWLPTLGYVVLLERLAPGAGQTGVALGCLLGTLLTGTSALAIGLLASSLTAHQLGAAGATFAGLSGGLLVGAAADTLPEGGALRGVLRQLDVRRHLEVFASGAIDVRAVAMHLAVAAVALSAASRVIDAPGASPSRARRYLAESVAVALACVGVAALAWLGPGRIDLDGAGSARLSPRTEQILDRLRDPVELTVLLRPLGGPADPGERVQSLVDRMAARSSLLRVERVGETELDRARELGRRFELDPLSLYDGVVVLASGPRRRVVARGELARIEADAGGVPHIVSFRAEQALDAALVAVSSERAAPICFTRGHGEGAIDSLADDGLSDLGEALRRDGAGPRDLASLDDGVPGDCDALVIAGAARRFAPIEVAALDRYLGGGGRVLAMIGTVGLGLEPVLERFGITVVGGEVFDPEHRLGRDRWTLDGGYADHPVTRGFAGRRTVWGPSLELRAALRPGVRAEPLAWREAGAGEPRPRAVAIAAEMGDGGARSGRLVVLGDAGLARNDRDVSYNRDLVVAAVAWLSARDPPAALEDAAGVVGDEPLRLDQTQLRRAFAFCVVGIPTVWLLLGCAVWWRRRR